MAYCDVFNGDADGLCALHQVHLAEPRNAELVTGVKRDIRLLERIAVRTAGGDRVTVIDLSVEPNAEALQEIRGAGSRIRWFDHHFPGPLSADPGLDATIDLSPEVCTSLPVDRYLNGRYRAWAIPVAYGDSLNVVAARLAAEAGLNADQAQALSQLGEAINYNAYGETIADLFMAPADLYGRLARYDDPLAFASGDAVAGELASLMSRDLARVADIEPTIQTTTGIAFTLPDESWARRISGSFANLVAERYPQLAVAVLTKQTAGHYQVSVRAPKNRPVGADTLCRQFPTGGGRSGAGGGESARRGFDVQIPDCVCAIIRNS